MKHACMCPCISAVNQTSTKAELGFLVELGVLITHLSRKVLPASSSTSAFMSSQASMLAPCACRENTDKQLFLLNSSLNNAILRTRDECVLVWELQLLGIEAGKVYSLQELQASYRAAAKVVDLPCCCLPPTQLLPLYRSYPSSTVGLYSLNEQLCMLPICFCSAHPLD